MFLSNYPLSFCHYVTCIYTCILIFVLLLHSPFFLCALNHYHHILLHAIYSYTMVSSEVNALNASLLSPLPLSHLSPSSFFPLHQANQKLITSHVNANYKKKQGNVCEPSLVAPWAWMPRDNRERWQALGQILTIDLGRCRCCLIITELYGPSHSLITIKHSISAISFTHFTSLICLFFFLLFCLCRGGGAGVGGINTAEVTAQLSEASKNAMSFLSSTVAAIGEKVRRKGEGISNIAAAAANTYCCICILLWFVYSYMSFFASCRCCCRCYLGRFRRWIWTGKDKGFDPAENQSMIR